MKSKSPFANHSRDFSGFSVVYPVVSRRSQGVSLGINLNPGGACNYACQYCQVPRHQLDASTKEPTVETVIKELDDLYRFIIEGHLFEVERFADTPNSFRKVVDISLSGDGEPSLYKPLAELLKEVMARAKDWDLSLQLISNGKGVLRENVADLLDLLRPGKDRIWLKADAWSQSDLEDIYEIKDSISEHQQFLESILERFVCWLQICVYKKNGKILSSVAPEEIGKRILNWNKKFSKLEQIQIYTLARQSFTPGLSALSDDELKKWSQSIAAFLRELPLSAYGEKGRVV